MKLSRWLPVMLVLAGPSYGAADSPARGDADAAPSGQADRPIVVCQKDDGYRGIWYAGGEQDDEYAFAYGGGLGTYPARHTPLAFYAEEARKTFFVYGGMPKDGHRSSEQRTLLTIISWYDHATGRVPRPRILMDRQTDDPHENPVLTLDGEGHVWVFVPGHGPDRPAHIYRSVEPYDIDAFELMKETSFSCPQVFHVDGHGFMLLHTRHEDGRRNLYFVTSGDGVDWSDPAPLAAMGEGHDQISWAQGDKVATAFNYYPEGLGGDHRTNVYYVETTDFGRTWRTAAGQTLELPMRQVESPAIVEDYGSMRPPRLVYLKDLNFDLQGRPIILYLLSRDHKAGPEGGRRMWTLARYFGGRWARDSKIPSDSNHDMGSLYVESPRHLELIIPVGRGVQRPQPYNPGGEMAVISTMDGGRSWGSGLLTRNSSRNHNYARRPMNAHLHFRAFWADGHGREPSESRLYFCDQTGVVYRLPERMTEELETPQPYQPPVRRDAEEEPADDGDEESGA